MPEESPDEGNVGLAVEPILAEPLREGLPRYEAVACSFKEWGTGCASKGRR
jgi:hypothetical protein